MKFQSIILIAIVGFYILSFVLKKIIAASKSVKQNGAGKTPEWKQKLNRYMAQVRQEMGPAKQEVLPGQTGWERVMPRVEDEPEDESEYEPGYAMEAPARTAGPAKKPSSKKIPVPARPARKTKPTTVSETQTRPKALGFGIADLRKAVIWSEILAPPLALRDL